MLLAAMMLFGLTACNSTDEPTGSSAGNPGSNTDTPGAADAGSKYLNVMLGTNVMSLDTNLATDGDSFEVIADCIDGLT